MSSAKPIVVQTGPSRWSVHDQVRDRVFGSYPTLKGAEDRAAQIERSAKPSKKAKKTKGRKLAARVTTGCHALSRTRTKGHRT